MENKNDKEVLWVAPPGATAPGSNPKEAFVFTLSRTLKRGIEIQQYSLDNGMMNNPNPKPIVNEAVQRTLEDVKLECDYYVPLEARNIKTNDEFFKFMEGYTPGVTDKYQQTMETKDANILLKHVDIFKKQMQDENMAKHLAKQTLIKKPVVEEKKSIFQKMFGL